MTMKAHSIRFKITAITVAAILVAIFAIVSASYSSTQQEAERRSVEVMRLIGENTKNTLNDYFVNVEQAVNLTANMAADSLDSLVLVECGAVGSNAGPSGRTPEQTARLDAYIAEHCERVLRTFESAASHTNGVTTYYYCINPEISETEHGFFYSRVGKAGFVAQPPLDARTLDPEDLEHTTWYYTPIQRGRPSWVGPYTAHFLDEMWTCSYLVPIYSTGTLIGVLGMDIPQEALNAHVSSVRVYDTGFASLCDTEGRILYHPELERGIIPSLSDIKVSRELLQNEDSGDTLIRYSSNGEQRQMAFSTLRNGMKLVITAPVKEINASWLRLVRSIALITLAVLIVAAVLVMLAMGIVTSPLQKLTAASQRLADADYDVELDYRADDEIGQLTQAFIRMRDQMKDYIADLNRRINTDALTGLPNMRHFFKLATAERKRLTDAGRASVMLYFDLVGMKHYNRQYGFEEGDKLLCEVGQILLRHFGAERLCRFSEDHFTAVCAEDELEEKLQAVFRESKGANGGNSVPIRVGIYHDSIEPVNVSIACDRAKYACDKHRGSYESGCYTFDSDMLAQLDGVRYIIRHLDQALAEHWIKVYYQPIIRAVNGRVCDEEALSRWVDPVRGTLSPAFFIPVLEKARLIYKLDLYVLDQILEKMKALEAEGLRVVPHSLNLSRADFDACDIVEEIRRRVDAAGIARDRLTIEITESIIGSDFDFMKEQVNRFHALGFQVWMDDFGSGYSSLDVLQEIHFDLLKFDMRFMKRFGEGKESKTILTDLVRMAIDLGVDTICEGVETAEEVEFLREIGCSKLQGFYYCRPIPFEEIVARNRKGIQIGFENPKESEYYASIGRVNLYAISMIDKEKTRKDYFDALPAGIMEVRENDVCYVRTNQAYRDFMEKNFSFHLKDRPCGYPVYPGGSESTFMERVRQCCADGSRALYDGKLTNGCTIHTFINPIGKNPVTGAAAVAVAILSVSEPDENTTYADIARALAADYYSIYLVNLDTDEFIEYSSRVGGEELSVERHGTDFFAAAKRDTMKRIYEEDRAGFLAWFSKENIQQELDRQGVFTATYRVIDTGEPLYVNMKVNRMSGGNRIIIGISNIDSQMKQKQLQDALQKDRDTMVRLMALTDGYLSLYTVDPVTVQYVENDSTDDFDSLSAAKTGNDFFRQAVIDARHVIHPEDLDMFLERFTKENILCELREHGSFSIQYRLMIGGQARPVLLKVASFKEHGDEKLVVGVRAMKERRQSRS